MKVRILHWNIWWKEDVENVLRVLREVDADVLLLQEVTDGCEYSHGKNVAEVISKEFGMEHNFVPAHDYGSHTSGNAIFSRFPMISNSNFFIAEAGEVHSFSNEARLCVASKLNLGDDKELTVATTHSSYYHKFVDGEKLDEAERLVKFFDEVGENLVFSGDLNAVPGGEFIEMIESRLKNCGPDYEKLTWTTKPFSYEGFEEDKLNWRLDYVFASRDVRVLSSEILETDVSDHLPILVEVEV